MKKIILINIGLCFLFILNAQTGSRFPLDETSVWRVDHIRNGVSDENNHGEGDEIYKYFIDGDTVIGSTTYYKIYKTGTSYFDVPFYYEHVYAGALRDADNKFFLVKKDAQEEVLLYDFNATIDDTIQVPYEDMFVEKVVSSVDILPDGRKIIHFNPKEPVIGCGDQYMIEGIGGSGGLPEGPACFHFWTFDNHLVCYLQSGLLIYHDNNFEFNCEIAGDPADRPYIDSTCVWRIDKQVTSEVSSDFEKFIYFIVGDTAINAGLYQKLYKSGYQLLIGGDGQVLSVFNDSVYIGALREDGHRLYFIGKGEDAEDLLYDFGIQAGETVDGTIFNGDTVRAVETILDNRKFYYMSESTWENYFMEGIGSDKGLLENGDEHSSLICFMRDGGTIYHNGNGSECSLNYDDISFPDCDKLVIAPSSPSDKDEVKVVSRLCYQVSYNHPDYPVISDSILTAFDNSFVVEQYYDYYDRNNADSVKTVHPSFDTLVLGNLSAGDYSVELIVHTIHKGDGYADTTFYDKYQYLSFTVSQTNDVVPVRTGGSPFRIYPVPAKDHIIIEMQDAGSLVSSVDFYNILGEKVQTGAFRDKSRDNRYEINISSLNKGIYMIRINTVQYSFIEKIIVE